MINLRLFGAGRIARIHAANIASHPEMILRSVVDFRQEAAQGRAEPYGARAGADPKAALADPAVDAVLIASSSNTHADLVMRAVAAKKPVFCEKPSISTWSGRMPACARSRRRACRCSSTSTGASIRTRPPTRRCGPARGAPVELVSITSRDPEPPLDYLENAPAPCFARPWCTIAAWRAGCSAKEPVAVHAMAA